MIYILVGGLILILQFMYHHQSVYFLVHMVYIHVMFIYIVYVYIVYAYCLYAYISLVLPLTNCVKFIHDWMKAFRGCMHMCYIMCN